jgi:hypothetical protein
MTVDPSQPENYHTYESNPVPWFIALLWGAFFIFGVSYLVINLLSG